MSMPSTFHISRLIKHRSKDAAPTELTEGSIVCLKTWTFIFESIMCSYLLNAFLAAYMSSPCHIELILSEKEEPVKKEVFD